MPGEQHPLRPWLWPSEVAELCCVSPATVYRWIEQGVLPTVLNRRPYKVPRAALRNILSQASQASQQ